MNALERHITNLYGPVTFSKEDITILATVPVLRGSVTGAGPTRTRALFKLLCTLRNQLTDLSVDVLLDYVDELEESQ